MSRRPNGSKDISGQRFGRLIAINDIGSNKHKSRLWLCQCDCGKQTKANTSELRNGHKKSCGCLFIEKAQIRGNEMADRNVFGFIGDTCASLVKSRKLQKNNTTGVRGVQHLKKTDKYKAIIMFKKKVYWLGEYKTLEEAAKIRKQAEEMLFEPFLEWYYEKYPDKKPKETA